MANTSHISKRDADYISSGNWICEKSPTNAHHWIEAREVEYGLFVCRYCLDNRKFPTTYSTYKQ